MPGPLPQTPKHPTIHIPTFPIPSTDLDADFASLLAQTYGRDGTSASPTNQPDQPSTSPQPAEPSAQPTDQPSTSTRPDISKSSAAKYFTPIPLQQENYMQQAVTMLGRISNQLTEIQASQQDGFRELSLRLDTLDINAHNTGMEHTADFTFHTRRLMNEVSRCIAQGTPHLPAVEERATVEEALIRNAQKAESEALIAAKGEKLMRALSIRLLHENNDLRHQLNLSTYKNIPKENNDFEAGLAEAELQERMAKAAAKEESDRYRKEKERVDYMRYSTIFEDTDDES